MSVFSFDAGDDGTAELMRQGLHSVAYSQDRDTSVKHPRRDQRGAIVVDTVRTAAEDDSFDILQVKNVWPGVEWDDFAVDVGFSHAACDEAAVL